MNSRVLLAIVALGAAGACESGTLVSASEGGVITSDDGAFRLVIPPGALDVDRYVSIRPLPQEEWPVGAPSRFERVGEVYAVEPAGLELREDAYVVQTLASLPDVLQSAEGDPVLAVHYVYGADEKVRPAPVTRTVLLADGRVAIVATIYDLGVHWTGERVPGADRALVMLSARLEAVAGEHAMNEQWLATRTGLFADSPLALVGREARASAVAPSAPDVEPIATDGWSARTWDATWDHELGLHPWEVLGIAPEGRTEVVASFGEPAPVTIGPDAPLDPLTTAVPGWTCVDRGGDEATLWLGVDVVSGASSGTVTTGLLREVGPARCR